MVLRPHSGPSQRPQLQKHDHGRLALRILTHNVRYATSSPSPNEKPWRDRLPLIMNQFFYHTRFLHGEESLADCSAAFICMQEVLHKQLHDILTSLNRIDTDESESAKDLPNGPLWAHIGVGRDNGKEAGEYSPIVYPVRLFDVLHFENTWLSPTPDEPSKGWDAGSIRILTTAVFQHKTTKKRIAVFNTHLDNEGGESREKSVPIILDVIERVRREWKVETDEKHLDVTSEGLDYVLAGDFNSRPNGEAYQAIVASDKMVDVHEVIPIAERYGSEDTFTGFQPKAKQKNDVAHRVDFIWLGPKSRVRDGASSDSRTGRGWKVKGYSVLPNVFDDGVFSSDHRCVVGDCVLNLSD